MVNNQLKKYEKKEGSKRKTTFEKKKVSSRFAWVIGRSGFNIGQFFTLSKLVNPPDQSEFNNYTWVIYKYHMS